MNTPASTSIILRETKEVDRLMAETDELLKSPESDIAKQDEHLLKTPPKKKESFLKSFAKDFLTCLLPFGKIIVTIRNAKEYTERANDQIARDEAEKRLIPFQQRLLTQYSMIIQAQQKLIAHLQQKDILSVEEIASLTSRVELLTAYAERINSVISKLPPDTTTEEKAGQS